MTLWQRSGRISAADVEAMPGCKLRTSPVPRMLEPFEVEILRQDLQQALKLLGYEDRAQDRNGARR